MKSHIQFSVSDVRILLKLTYKRATLVAAWSLQMLFDNVSLVHLSIVLKSTSGLSTAVVDTYRHCSSLCHRRMLVVCIYTKEDSYFQINSLII